MFASAFGLFSCSNFYHCLQSFVLSVLSIATLLFYAKAYKIITKDRSQIMEKMDKIIFYLAFIYICFLTFMRVLYVAPFLAFTLRVLFLILDIVICSVVACIYFSQDKHAKIEQLMMGCFGWTVLIWFFSVMGKQSTDVNAENECRYFSIILFSLTGLIVSGVLAFCAHGSIKRIRATEMKDDNYTDGTTRLDDMRGYQELNNQINQLTILIVVTAGSSIVQMLWDIKKYHTNYSMNQCARVSYPHTFIDLITFTIMEVISTLLPSWGIFYLYYWKNKDNFRGDAGNWERHLSDFDEIRSDLIEA